MILKMFSVYDSKVGAYLSPFFMQSRGAAVRAFSDTAQDSSNMIGKHPGDYTLFELGEFSDEDALVTLHSAYISLGVGSEFLSRDSILES